MAKRKPTANHKGHFFASSFAEWMVDESMDNLVKRMSSSRFQFQVIWVPLPKSAPYNIDNYVPDVEGCVMIARYDF